MNQESKRDKIKKFTDLITWKEGHKLVLKIYELTKKFPKDERFGLTDQIRRATVSITSNIAEGFSRYSYKDKVRFYYNALGSITEIQNQLLIARDVGYINNEEFNTVAHQSVYVNKLTNGLIKKSKSMIPNS